MPGTMKAYDRLNGNELSTGSVDIGVHAASPRLKISLPDAGLAQNLGARGSKWSLRHHTDAIHRLDAT